MRTLEKYEKESVEKGVTFGRMSPIKNGHRRGIEEILEYCKQLSIGVIDSNTPRKNVPNKFRRFCDAADKKNSPSHTLFSVEERFEMTKLALSDLIKDGNIIVNQVPRPEYDIDTFTKMFPKDIYQVLFSKVEDDPFDRERNRIMEEILGREILFVDPLAPILHNSDILKKIDRNEINWEDVIPKGSYEAFMKYAKKHSQYNLK